MRNVLKFNLIYRIVCIALFFMQLGWEKTHPHVNAFFFFEDQTF